MKLTNVSNYINQVRKEGFIISDHGDDKRIKYHSLTTKGRQHLDTFGSEPVKNDEFYSFSESSSAEDSEKVKTKKNADIEYNDEFSIKTEEGEILSF